MRVLLRMGRYDGLSLCSPGAVDAPPVSSLDRPQSEARVLYDDRVLAESAVVVVVEGVMLVLWSL